MTLQSLWITGGTQSGKTTHLIEQMQQWGPDQFWQKTAFKASTKPANKTPKTIKNRQVNRSGCNRMALIFAANSHNRLRLVDQINQATQGQYPFRSTTPLAFFEDEVLLFWPLLVEALHLKTRLPLRLRPEMEQEMATRFWHPALESGQLSRLGVNPDRIVRQVLDIFQLAALGGVPLNQVNLVLEQGFSELEQSSLFYALIRELLLGWRGWCLDRGFLTYGLIAELYGQHLLNHPAYPNHLIERYSMVLADDVDEYPAIARHLFERFLEPASEQSSRQSYDIKIAFTHNPAGAVRWGLGADPDYLEALQWHCQAEVCLERQAGFAPALAEPLTDLVLSPTPGFLDLSNSSVDVRSLQTVSRANLLRRIGTEIITAIQSGQVSPAEIAVIGPGLDEIARYSLREILIHADIAVEAINEQRPLSSSPMIRALLTLLTLVYPGLGRLVDRDAVAEMLVVLSQPVIDPVRAGLLVDHCFVPDRDQPHLLGVTAFSRWDRLGYQVTEAYGQILQWLEIQRSQQQQRLLPNPVSLLDRAIQRFFVETKTPGSGQLAVLRELIETAIHYWEVESRLLQRGSTEFSPETLQQFIQLLRRGIVTANPYPVSPLSLPKPAITLATVFQYRANRQSHPWQFWLDAGSVLWLEGGSSELWGAPLFLQEQVGQPWTVEQQTGANLQRLRRVLLDLLSRVRDRLYLCHSDLAVSGHEQLGPLLPLVYGCQPLA